MKRPEVVEWIASHGGLQAIHVVPFTVPDPDGGPPTFVGWQNVYICHDGIRRGLSPDEEKSIDGHHDVLRAAKATWLSQHPQP